MNATVARGENGRAASPHGTLVVQSHRTPLPYAWIERCLASVRVWCARHGYAYRFIGDELFARLPTALRDKTRKQLVVATDLARLLVLQEKLREGYHTVLWIDADVLVISPTLLVLPDTPCAVGREVWVQHDRHGRLRCYRKVHNAFLMFRRGDSFLDFYADTAARLLALNAGPMPPQFLGPKLLTALHSVACLPVLESAGMLSPLVIRDMLSGGGPALDLFMERSSSPAAAVNLCSSSCDSGQISARELETLIDHFWQRSRPFDGSGGRAPSSAWPER